jgi:uncharacterized membrane protein YcaP (DUF421 family)
MMYDIIQLLEYVFGGDEPQRSLGLGQIAARSTVIYVSGLAIVRLGKSRLLSKTSALDVILGFLLGSLLSRGITGSASLSGTIVASMTLVGLHWVLTAITSRSPWWENLVKGHVRPLISDGEILRENMRMSHISEGDLREELRLNANLDDPHLVKMAYKERSGQVGVIKRESKPKVVEVEVREGVQTVRIELLSSG